MKKKTVITTEKREVWVIRQGPSEPIEKEWPVAEGDRSLNPMDTSRDERGDSSASPDEEN
jgi:hypothetical protein